MNKFIRENLPDPYHYYADVAGLKLDGKGTWLTGPCEFHGSRATMRVNKHTGGYVCMAACGARGGNVLDYHRAKHGMGFVEAAKALGAYIEDGKAYTGPTRPTAIPARDLLRSVADELQLCAFVLSDALNGRFNDNDYDRYRAAASRVIYVAGLAA
jgi:hypothetical protein